MSEANRLGRRSKTAATSLQRPHDRDAVLIGTLAVIVAVSTFSHTQLPEVVHEVTTLVALAAFGLMAVRRLNTVGIPRYALYAYLAIWLIYLSHAVFPAPFPWALVRIPVFVATSFVCLFLVPSLVPLERFQQIIFYVAGVATLLGLPTLVVGDYTGFGLGVSQFQFTDRVPLYGATVHPITSVYTNPNGFAKIAGLGFLSGLGVAFHSRRPEDFALLAAIGLALVATLSRGAALGVAAGGSLFVAYRLGGRRLTAVLAALGIAVTATFVAALAGLVPDLLGVRAAFRYSRLDIWTAGVKTVRSAPLFGIGFRPLKPFVGYNNVHSGYLFVLLTRGAIGLVIHLVFLGIVFARQVAAVEDATDAALLGMLTMVLTTMAFDSAALFGLAVNAVWPSLVVGYALRARPRPVASEPTQAGRLDGADILTAAD